MGSDIEASGLTLSSTAVKKVMHQNSDRITDDAATRVAHLMEVRIDAITKAAQVIAENDGRKTVMEKDVRAARNVYKIMMED